jgi:hypothetical protein
MPTTVPLSKALTTHKGDVNELVLRDLDARDMVEVRQPPIKLARVGDEVTQEYRYDVVMKLASLLTGIDDLVLGKLSAGDFHKLTGAVVDAWNASGE